MAVDLLVDDSTDHADCDRGFKGSLDPMVIRASDGRIVWDMDGWSFLNAECPTTANPSLWRQCQLNARHGLYEVTERIYQIRGFDLSNMTLVEGASGVIVIDPLVSEETAAAGLALYRTHRGDRPVAAVIYTHSHVDHFGGVLGVVPAETTVPIVAPEHFLEHAISENVYAGTAMIRRAGYYDGRALSKGPDTRVGIGLGPGASSGTVGLIAPTLDITHTGQEEVLDGVRIIFQLTPGTEAPAEMNFYFPDYRALCMAENASHNLHNLLTLRGAQVRDARVWSRYLAESIELFADRSDVAFASHHWPTWGSPAVRRYLSEQRDLYAYLHDQTVRRMNQGYIGSEIAEMLEMPPRLERAWHARGYYGSVSHNVKAIYQRYLGWYDGNPAHLWQHPAQETAKRYVQLFGGVDATVRHARDFAERGDLRFAAELASHAVFVDDHHTQARATLAYVLERLGHGAECATWRNCYLSGAYELRHGIQPEPAVTTGLAAAMTVTQLFDSIALRIDGKRAWDEQMSIAWQFTDSDERYHMELSNGALIHYPTRQSDGADLTITLTRQDLLRILATGTLVGVAHTGDPSVMERLLALTDRSDPDFPIVTP